MLNRAELKARQEIYLEQYCKTVRTEANLVIRMAHTIIYPAGMRYQGELAATAANMRAIGKDPKTVTLAEITSNLRLMQDASAQLEDVLNKADSMGYGFEAAQSYRDNVLPRMLEVRRYADMLEVRVADDLWALPNYQEILFGK